MVTLKHSEFQINSIHQVTLSTKQPLPSPDLEMGERGEAGVTETNGQISVTSPKSKS